MSIGAGCPKFSTWSTISAGWKKNCSAAKRCGSSRRSRATSSRRRRCAWLERDQNLAVHRADRRRIAQGDVHAAVGQADIVENGIDLHRRRRSRGWPLRPAAKYACVCSMPRARRRAHVQSHLPGIDLRERSRARGQGTAAANSAISTPKNSTVRQRLGQRPGKRVAVALAEALESRGRTRSGSRMKRIGALAATRRDAPSVAHRGDCTSRASGT